MRRVAALAAGALVLAACETYGTEDTAPQEQGAEVEQSPEAEEDALDDDGVAPDGPLEAIGPPPDEIGVPVGFDPVIVEGEEAVVALTGMTVYRDGMELVVAVRWSPAEGPTQDGPPGGPMSPAGMEDRPTSEDELDDELLRVEVTYPDGSVASSVGHLLATAAGEEPEEPVLDPYQGSGDARSWDQQVWVHPLPAEGDGPLELTVAWPAFGIDEQQPLEVEVTDLEEASERVVVLWE